MNETTKPKFDRREEADNFRFALTELLKVCEENVKNSFDRDDQMDIVCNQKRLIEVLKMAGNAPYHFG